ncbi:calcineurin B homologous protein 3 [Calliphora vicina]|uniref:calcineurin B homologous protein 3 n=1 Tax=Calliphora vicina TaxID=7373 RepID=UPI00325B2CC0
MFLGSLLCCRSRKPQGENLQCPQEYIKVLKETTALKTGQITHLYKCFCNLAKDSLEFPPQHLKKSNFLCITSLQSNPILSILLAAMFGERKHLKFLEFAKYLSNFQACSSSWKSEQIEEIKQRKLKMLFNMYDHDKNGLISEEDLIFVVHKLFSDIWNSEQIMNVASMMMLEMDNSHTNQILFNDFCSALAVFDMEECLITKIPSGGRN